MSPKSPLAAACWAAALTLALIAVAVWAPVVIGREKPTPRLAAPAAAARERYGPPPGRARALAPEELPPRGVHDWDRAYEGSSAGALAHYIERTA